MYGFRGGVLLLLVPYTSVACAQSRILVERATTSSKASPTPISFPAAQNWDGPDGPWSTFTIRVGTPAQDVRVLVSSASQDTWVVLPQGCLQGDTTCPDARGSLFNPNTSSTWAQTGYYELFTEQNLGIPGNGLFGNDTLGLGVQGSGGPTLQNQVIGGIGTQDFYIGMFGVNPKPTNFSGLGAEGQPSFITSLKNQSLIPSVSFGYTAGAQYRLKSVLGSLTLGGYDQSRFTPNHQSFTFAPDTDRDIVVGIQTIIATDQNGKAHSLLPSGINAYVDSTVPQIWLPLEACSAFETAFGLTYDNKTGLYLVNDTLHASLLSQNPSISFTLGNTGNGGPTTNITLPYASFDLTVTPPIVSSGTRYFPLRRAANQTQYTLGRTFLQEAYLIVDWERSNFSISQCIFNDNMQQNIVAIKSIADSANTTMSGNANRGESSSSGKTIGIVVAVVVVVILAVGGAVVFFVLKRRKRRREAEEAARQKEPEQDPAETIRQGFAKAELDTDFDHTRYEMGGSDFIEQKQDKPPAEWVNEKAQYPGERSVVAEAPGEDVNVPELASRRIILRPLHEMYDPSVAPVELPAQNPLELPGSPPPLPTTNSGRPSPILRSAARSPVDRSMGASPRSRSSAQPSPIDRNLGRTPPPRSSSQTQNSAPFPASRYSRAMSPPSRTGTASPRTNEMFSPISPLRNEETSPPQEGLFSFVRGLTQHRSSGIQSSSARQATDRTTQDTGAPHS